MPGAYRPSPVPALCAGDRQLYSAALDNGRPCTALPIWRSHCRFWCRGL